MDTINTTTPPFITNTFLGTTFFSTILGNLGFPSNLVNTRLEPTVSGVFKIDDGIILFFEEQVISGSGDIVISSDADTRHINIEDASQVAFDTLPVIGGFRSSHFEFGRLFINLTTDLLPDTTYTIQIDNSTLVDTVGNALAGFDDIVIRTVDSAPNLVFSNPTNDFASFIRADENFFLFFDETVVAGSGEIVISSDTDTRTIDINDISQVTFENNLLSINPQEDLNPNTAYTLQVPDGAVVDVENNIFTNSNPITFTTIAGVLPQLLSPDEPINDPDEFQVDDNLELLFNEAVKAGIGNIVISSDSDVRTIAINDTSQVTFINGFSTGRVIIDPTDDLIPNVSYTVQINSGAITDQSGNAYGGFDNLVISTLEAEEAVVARFFPSFGPIIADGIVSSLKIDENIVLGFTLNDVLAGSGNIIISNGSDSRTIAIDDTSQVTFDIDTDIGGTFPNTATIVTIDPTEDLIPDTTYTVQIPSSAIIGMEESIFAGINEVLFTTVDSGPIVLPLRSTIFKTEDDFVLTFDEAIIAGEGDIVISNGMDVRTIAINDTSQVTFLGRSIVIDPNDDIAPGQYTGTITSGAITDRAGNAFAGIDNDSITILDSAPILTASNPFNGSPFFRVDEDITLFFDENVAIGSGNIIISNGTDTRTIAIDDASQVTFEESNVVSQLGFPRDTGIVNINPTEDLVPGTTYTAEMAPGVIIDTDGNPYAGFSDASFATTDALPVIAAGANESVLTFG